MLILTRRIGEVVVIGADIRITVLSLKGNQARLGVTAPPDTLVNREEVHQKLHSKHEQLQAKD